MKNVLVLMPVEARHKAKLEAAGKGCCFTYCTPGEVTAEQIQGANAILGQPKAEMIAASENLEWLQLESAGGRGACLRPDAHAAEEALPLPG